MKAPGLTWAMTARPLPLDAGPFLLSCSFAAVVVSFCVFSHLLNFCLSFTVSPPPPLTTFASVFNIVLFISPPSILSKVAQAPFHCEFRPANVRADAASVSIAATFCHFFADSAIVLYYHRYCSLPPCNGLQLLNYFFC